MPIPQRAALLALLLFSAGCEDRPALEQAQATPVPAVEGLAAGTPDGDLAEWVAEVRTGLETLGKQVGSDRAAVQKQVVDLYVGRQEYMEMYYGPTGRMKPAPELSAAVKTAEDRFHELMILTGSTPPSESGAIRTAIAALDAQLAKVLELRDRSALRVRGDSR